MHYPVMTEKHVADRWQVSLKTLRRWRLDGDGPVWHKLFRHVRHHEADVLEFEQTCQPAAVSSASMAWRARTSDVMRTLMSLFPLVAF